MNKGETMKDKLKKVFEFVAPVLISAGLMMGGLLVVLGTLAFRFVFWALLMAGTAWVLGEDPTTGAMIGVGVALVLTMIRSARS